MEDARIMSKLREAHTNENFTCHIIPVFRGATQAITGLLEQPVLASRSRGIAKWWTINGDLFVRQSGVAKCILAVTLLEFASVFDGSRDDHPEGVIFEDRSSPFMFATGSGLHVSHNDHL